MPTDADADAETRRISRDALFRNPGEQARPCLAVLSGPQVGETYRVSKAEMIVGRDPNADIQLLDDSISRRHVRVREEKAEVEVEDLNSKNGISVNGQRVERAVLREGDKLQIGDSTVLRFTYQDSIDESFHRLMFDSALRDGLTGAFNKRYFVDRLENELRFAQRHLSPLSLLLVDLDHFKAINDLYGHVAGDAVLKGVAQSMQETIRVEDVLARYGGEEFAVICRGVAPGSARRLAERIRTRTEDLLFEDGGRKIGVTLSVGVAGLPDLTVTMAEGLVRAADAALYTAKKLGRNRVEVATVVPEVGSPSLALLPGQTRPLAPLTDRSAEGVLRAARHPTRAAVVPSALDAPRLTLPPDAAGRNKK
ncbi:MAG: GGDEF domain-containing protein [Deltaproteobacteria bacterium]